jgi:glycosyltransferase involved in cell wall biosynthesis
VSERLKVAIALEATAGGTRKHVRELALGLDASRFEVHLVLSFCRSREMRADLALLRGRGIRVHTVCIHRRIDPVADLHALARLTRLFRRERFDVVHTQSSKAGFIGRLAARIAGVKRVLHTPHVWPFQWTRPPMKNLFLALEKRAARWCDRIVCVGREQCEIGLAYGVAPEERMVVIRNGVDVTPAPTARERAAVREELGVAQGEVVVGMVARLEPQKGVGRFIDAAAMLAREHANARFFLVGAGRLGKRMAARAAAHGLGPDRLTFLGHRDDAARLYAVFDVFVLSSLYEGLPYVILEAMAAGLPVVATDVTGTREVVENDVTGTLVPMGDAPAIARGITPYLDDEALRAATGDRARARVGERFTTARFIELHEGLYAGGG